MGYTSLSTRQKNGTLDSPCEFLHLVDSCPKELPLSADTLAKGQGSQEICNFVLYFFWCQPTLLVYLYFVCLAVFSEKKNCETTLKFSRCFGIFRRAETLLTRFPKLQLDKASDCLKLSTVLRLLANDSELAQEGSMVMKKGSIPTICIP